MSLDLHVHAEVDVGVLLPAGHRGVLHRVQVYSIQICEPKNNKSCFLFSQRRHFGRDTASTFDADGHVRIDALPGVLQADFFNLNCEQRHPRLGG